MKHSEIISTIARHTGNEPTQQEIAEILGLTRNAISSRAFRDKEYSYSDVEKIQKHYGINFTTTEDIVNKIIKQRFDSLEQKDDFTADYYPEVFGSCGSGVFVLSEAKEQIQVPKKIVENYSMVKKYSVINAYGDSMMPFIHDKDLLIVEHYDGEQIKDNRIYVFRFGENIFVKRLVLNINQLVIKSDNPEYKPIILELNKDTDIQIIGQIVGLMRGMV